MIWSLVTKEEMEGFGTTPVFRFYREALGKDNVKLAVVDEKDLLSFVGKDDVVLLRSANWFLINTLTALGIKTTAEKHRLYELVRDKEELARHLYCCNSFVLCPKQYHIKSVNDGHTYFVKPRYGSDSKGVTDKSICHSKKEVEEYVEYLHKELGQEALIEDFIEGEDYTVACLMDNGKFVAYPIKVECEETGTIQTRECKLGYKECCSAVVDESLMLVSELVFSALGIKHHARIDFRRGKDGKYYLIDINLLPGLGISDHFAKSAMLCANMSYRDILMKIVNSASVL